ncbi:hypothetical protein I2I05_20755 [Hymenobacter sp. BT683]|uniref:Lipoprotein n=1 Tax=Hymenobacter jeongseonensis TaxID=2791027 RepID=A0ABS0IN84_9BACT|nr:hypothetical protein [Hymenobacter jeongseonensis]MBF9239837.1 hypothetical protein [Hymenobacter jeongseonensis]
MKHYLILVASGLLLAGCNSESTTDAATTTLPATATAATDSNPDPRVATIRQQHEQLLVMQKEYVAQLSTLKGFEKLSPARTKKSTEHFNFLIEQSQANLTALDQLDEGKAQEPTQITLVGEFGEKQASLLSRGEKQLAGIHNEHYLPQ